MAVKTKNLSIPGPTRRIVGLKVDDAEYELLKEAADANGGMSKMIRQALDKFLGGNQFSGRRSLATCHGLTHLTCSRIQCGKKTGRLYGPSKKCWECFSRIHVRGEVTGGFQVGDEVTVKGQYVGGPGRRILKVGTVKAIDVNNDMVTVEYEGSPAIVVDASMASRPRTAEAD